MATGIDQKKEELGEVESSIDEVKEELQRVNREQSSINSQIASIDDDLEQKEKELREIESQMAITQKQLEETRLELTDTVAELEKTQDDLRQAALELEQAIEDISLQEQQISERLRVMYMNNNASYLELLLESQSLNELLNKITMVKELMDYDQEVLSGLQFVRDDIEIKKQELEDQEETITLYKSQIESKKATLENKEKQIKASKDKIAVQKQEIQSRKSERELLLGQLDQEKASIRKELDELDRLSKQLERTITNLIQKQKGTNQPSSPYSGGALAWPVPGYEGKITSPFGNRIHPISRDYRFHSGIDIAGYAVNGKSAVSAANGVVIYASWYGGYGNTVIIDHGNGITTLYAHGSSIAVSPGQQVQRGQTVLRVGTTGNSTGPHLHFEVRKNGSAVNPMSYFN